VAELTQELANRDIPLEVYPGGDIRVDERLIRLLDAGILGTAADAGRHLLLELPHEVFVSS
jgi:tyrosine-protein phosphatase YwqE